MKFKFTVSELSKYTYISPRTIRYYDSIGLFKPSFIDEKNGYRYYNIEKLEELRLIHYMRYLDIPINEIKIHLEKRDIDYYENILETHLEKTNYKIQHLMSIKNKLETRMISLKKVKSIPEFDKILFEHIDKSFGVRIRRNFMYEEDWEKQLGRTESKLKLPPNLIIGNVCFSIDKENLEKGLYKPYNSIFIMLDRLEYVEKNHIENIEKSKCLSLYFRGNHEISAHYYELMTEYIKKNKMSISGESMECTLIDHYISGDKNFHITNIKIPIY